MQFTMSQVGGPILSARGRRGAKKALRPAGVPAPGESKRALAYGSLIVRACSQSLKASALQCPKTCSLDLLVKATSAIASEG